MTELVVLFGVPCENIPDTKSGDPARTLIAQNWNKMDKQLSSDWVENINMVDVAEQHYAKELNKATCYIHKIKETLNTGVKEDLLLAYKKIWDVNKTLKASANLVKDAMLEAEK